MKALFVTGTDTHIGKTIACAWLCQHWQADYWKPIQSGLEAQTDSEIVQQLSPHTRIHPERYRLQAPLSPHLAAQLEHQTIELNTFKLPQTERLIVEGAGGCLVPLNWKEQTTDLITHLDLCALLVTRSTLGTINHTCLSLQALHAARIPVLGVIMVGPENPHNREAIEHFGQVPVLATLPPFETLTPHALAELPLPNRLLKALNSL